MYSLTVCVCLFVLLCVQGCFLYYLYKSLRNVEKKTVSIITGTFTTLNNLSVAVGKLNDKINNTNDAIKKIVQEYNVAISKLDKKSKDIVDNVERITKECNDAINNIHQEYLENKELIKQIDLRTTDIVDNVERITKECNDAINDIHQEYVESKELIKQIDLRTTDSDKNIYDKLLDTINPNKINKNNEDMLSILDKENSVSDIQINTSNNTIVSGKPHTKNTKYNFKNNIREKQGNDVEKLIINKRFKNKNQ